MQTNERLEEARRFLEELAESPPALPYEPELLPMLFAATRENSTASIDDLTALIERSQKLASRVLSIANSALYALESTITSLRRAISILGFREVRTLVVMLGAVSAIKGAKLPRNFDATALWRHQLKAATIAKTLAAELGGPAGICGPAAIEENRLVMTPDEAYAAGLLHDIGQVFFAAGRPDVWEAVDDLRRKSSLESFEAEDAYWGIDHALIGAQVLHYWKLPLLLTDPINWHHAPGLAPAYKMEARLLSAANHIAHSGLDKEGALPEAVASLMPEDIDLVQLGTVVAQSLDNDAAAESFIMLVK
ncbi:MAG: HDOD domain-containing protein [Desulfovibrionaceae bacterium]|nr:HDOD domain-containing protein [Desulfovibrionaceae bacterium]